MTHEELVRLEAIERWANHAWHRRCTVLEAVEAIVGLAQRIQTDHSPQANGCSTTLGAPNEAAGRRVNVPGPGPDPREVQT